MDEAEDDQGVALRQLQGGVEANRLIRLGRIQPILSATAPLDDVGGAAAQVHANRHEGKIGVRCLAPRDGLGVTDPARREQVGEDRITLFRRHG